MPRRNGGHVTNAKRKRQIEILTDSRDIVAAVSVEQANRGEKWLADELAFVSLKLHAEVCELENGRPL